MSGVPWFLWLIPLLIGIAGLVFGIREDIRATRAYRARRDAEDAAFVSMIAKQYGDTASQSSDGSTK